MPILTPPYILEYCEEDNWSEWKEDMMCQTECMEKSKGVRAKRRSCKHGSHKTANCGEPYYDVFLCDDSTICTGDRETISEFTRMKCFQFIKNVRINVKLKKWAGAQAAHDVKQPWKACTVHCKRQNSDILYDPRLEMISYGIDPYLPDGTWCHNENGQDYYCRQHYCLPENYSQITLEKVSTYVNEYR